VSVRCIVAHCGMCDQLYALTAVVNFDQLYAVIPLVSCQAAVQSASLPPVRRPSE